MHSNKIALTDGFLSDSTWKLGKICTDAVITITNTHSYAQARVQMYIRMQAPKVRNSKVKGNFAYCIAYTYTHTHTPVRDAAAFATYSCTFWLVLSRQLRDSFYTFSFFLERHQDEKCLRLFFSLHKAHSNCESYKVSHMTIKKMIVARTNEAKRNRCTIRQRHRNHCVCVIS